MIGFAMRLLPLEGLLVWLTCFRGIRNVMSLSMLDEAGVLDDLGGLALAPLLAVSKSPCRINEMSGVSCFFIDMEGGNIE